MDSEEYEKKKRSQAKKSRRQRRLRWWGGLAAFCAVFSAGGAYWGEQIGHREEPRIVLVQTSKHTEPHASHLEEPVTAEAPRPQRPTDMEVTGSACETAIRTDYVLANIGSVSRTSFSRDANAAVSVYRIELSGSAGRGGGRLTYLVECRVTNLGQLSLRLVG